jgi:uncharacterized tellurite resistance protein B-like protein
VTTDPWSRATFIGTERGQAEVIAALTVDERLALLEQLLEIAEASGALRKARDAKQRAINDLWATS